YLQRTRSERALLSRVILLEKREERAYANLSNTGRGLGACRRDRNRHDGSRSCGLVRPPSPLLQLLRWRRWNLERLPAWLDRPGRRSWPVGLLWRPPGRLRILTVRRPPYPAASSFLPAAPVQVIFGENFSRTVKLAGGEPRRRFTFPRTRLTIFQS